MELYETAPILAHIRHTREKSRGDSLRRATSKRTGKASSRQNATPASCLHCESPCRLTTGAEVYPHLPKLHAKHICVCDHRDARVGCHGETTRPLGHAANAATRQARMALHKMMLDPLWQKMPKDERKDARVRTYEFLAMAL